MNLSKLCSHFKIHFLRKRKKKQFILKLNKIFWFVMTGLYLTDCRKSFQITMELFYLYLYYFHGEKKKKSISKIQVHQKILSLWKPFLICLYCNLAHSQIQFFWNTKRVSSTPHFWLSFLSTYLLFFSLTGLFYICPSAAGCHSFAGAALSIWKAPESLSHILSLNLPFLFSFSLICSMAFSRNEDATYNLHCSAAVYLEIRHHI